MLANDNTTGKLKTPVQVMVTSAPNNIKGWCYQLVLTPSSTDPTVVANQSVVTPLYSQAGLVPSPADGIPVAHTFALDTPTSMVSTTVWLQSGLLDSTGNFNANPIVPGITPCWPITYGSTTGTIDATQVLQSSIDASMAVTSGLFGVAPAGITNPLLGSGAVATINIQALAITNPLLANLCVEAANLASGSVTSTAIAAAAVGTAAIQNAAITNALIANLAVSGAQIQSATITGANIASATIAGANIASATIGQANMASASIGSAQIQSLAVTDAHISNVNVSKLVAGTAQFSGTVTFQNGSSGSRLVLTSNTINLTVDGTNGLSVDSSGNLSVTSSGATTVIHGNSVTTNSVTTGSLTIDTSTITFPPTETATSASAGSASALPSAPLGYLNLLIGTTPVKVPYYGT